MDPSYKYHKYSMETHGSPHQEHKLRRSDKVFPPKKLKKSTPCRQIQPERAASKELVQTGTQTCIRFSHRHESKMNHKQEYQGEGATYQPSPIRQYPIRREQHGDLPGKLIYRNDNVQKRTYRLPSMPPERTDPKGADGDRLLYKNSHFGKESNYGNGDDSEWLLSVRHSSYRKDSSVLESARALCRQTNAEFCAKYDTQLHLSDSESVSSTETGITEKSGETIRTVVRSQIKLRQSMNLPSMGLSDDVAFSPMVDKNSETVSMNASCSSSWEAEELPSNVRLEDMVNSKVIAPMMRRVQRMYLNNLQEEMQLMEALEQVPCQVGQLIKTVKSRSEMEPNQRRNSRI